MTKKCGLCPRSCNVDRTAGQKGFCRAGMRPAVYSYGPHHGEEPPISGKRGSGTIFFTHCNARCVYCQNYRFSQESDEKEISIEELSRIMLELEEGGCHNINLVTPTHYSPQIVEAVQCARGEGLKIPIVYNTSGYELADVIKLLDGIVSIYLTDMRYSDDSMAEKYSSAPGYKENSRNALIEMHRQVGNLKLDRAGIGVKGVVVRCLVLPNGISGTEDTLEFIASRISKDTYISLMSQYYPVHKAYLYPELSRRISDAEYKAVMDKMHSLGLNKGWIQDPPLCMDDTFGGHRIKPKIRLRENKYES